VAKTELDAKDVLPNINHRKAAEITPGSNGMVTSAAEWRHLQPARSIPSLAGGDKSAQHVFWPWWPWHSNSSEWGPKHVLPVNLVQIRSAVPEIFDSQTKTVSESAKNRTLRSSLRVVKIGQVQSLGQGFRKHYSYYIQIPL